jgi:hypothetical protein
MKTPIVAFALITAVALSGYAFAEPQPLTRGACDAAGMDWNDDANVCGVAVMAADESADSAQPLTRAACDAAGMTWNDSANACGVEMPAQPLTRADCDAASMSWNDSANACGVPAIAAASAKSKKTMMAPGEKKVVKKVTTRHGTKKTVKRKTAHGTTVKKEKRPFLNWLKSSRNQ